MGGGLPDEDDFDDEEDAETVKRTVLVLDAERMRAEGELYF